MTLPQIPALWYRVLGQKQILVVIMVGDGALHAT